MTLSVYHTIPVSSGLLDPRHVQTIGRSVWIYLWFVDRVTRDEQRVAGDFVGIVLNGRPLSIETIAEELGFDYHACRRQVAHLVKTGYLERKKTGAGMFTYVVTKSKKWAWKRKSAGARNRGSSATEKQADLFAPTDGSTEQKMLSGSQEPHDKICSLGADPQSRKCNSTEQNLSCGRKRTRARSQETTRTLTHTGTESESSLEDLVTKIAAEHPGLAHQKGRPLSQAQEFVIAEAIVRDGHELVMAGTCNLRDAVARWPKPECRYIPNPVRFYQQSEYLKDPMHWDRGAEKKPLMPRPRKWVSQVMNEQMAGLALVADNGRPQ
jgi:hypothetical protein